MNKADNITNGNVNITCEYCGGCGYHKMSCPTQKVTIWFDKDSLDKMYESIDKELANTFIPTLEGDEAEEFIRKCWDECISKFLVNTFIPTLEGDEAEEFIRKVESAERATIDWSRQMKQMERILEKSRIANRKLKYTKGEAPKVKRSKDVEE